MNRLWLSIFAIVFVWSLIQPKDYLIWLLETFPAIIGLIILLATHKTFPLTGLCYKLILIHSIILMVGAHYTYAEVPLFDWIKEALNQDRNNYDKLGHLAQGFIPAIIAREIIIRNQVLTHEGWLNFFILCICLSISALYEMIEWLVALASEQAADAFLGTQGFEWDTQSDMAYALLGAALALLLLRKAHDRQLEQLQQQKSAAIPDQPQYPDHP